MFNRAVPNFIDKDVEAFLLRSLTRLCTMTTQDSEKTSPTPRSSIVFQRTGAVALGALSALLILGSAFTFSKVNSEQEQARASAVELPPSTSKKALISHASTFNASDYDLGAAGAVNLDSMDGDVAAVMGPFSSASEFCALHYAQELEEEETLKCVEYTLGAGTQKGDSVMLIVVGEDPALKPDGTIDYFVATSSPNGWMASHWKTRSFEKSSTERALVTSADKAQAPAFAVSVSQRKTVLTTTK